jgi:hypothetical protein
MLLKSLKSLQDQKVISAEEYNQKAKKIVQKDDVEVDSACSTIFGSCVRLEKNLTKISTLSTVSSYIYPLSALLS